MRYINRLFTYLLIYYIPEVGFSIFGGDILGASKYGVKKVFRAICLRRNVVALCHKLDSLMHGTAMHQRILFVARDS